MQLRAQTYCTPTISNTGVYINSLQFNYGTASQSFISNGNSGYTATLGSSSGNLNQYHYSSFYHSISNSTGSAKQVNLKGYADWNNDGDFDDLLEVFLNYNVSVPANSSSTTGGGIVPELAAIPGNIRIRFVLKSGTDTATVCGTAEEVEDYYMVVQANVAPVLNTSLINTLSSIKSTDTNNEGFYINELVDMNEPTAHLITDTDDRNSTFQTAVPRGIAIYNQTATNGTWQYKVGSGSWTNFGSVSASNALHLLADASLTPYQNKTKIRFVPTGVGTPTFDFRAWDGTNVLNYNGTFHAIGSTGGASSYSANTSSASLPVLLGSDFDGTKMYLVNDHADQQLFFADINRTTGIVTEPNSLLSGSNSYKGYDVAIDETNGKIYWSNVDSYDVSYCNLDGSGVSAIANVDANGLTGVAVGGNKVYYSGYSGIQVSNLDGSSRASVAFNISDLCDIGDIEYDNGKLYFIYNTCSDSKYKVIQCSTDGTGLTVLYSATNVIKGLNVVDGTAYWTENNSTTKEGYVYKKAVSLGSGGSATLVLNEQKTGYNDVFVDSSNSFIYVLDYDPVFTSGHTGLKRMSLTGTNATRLGYYKMNVYSLVFNNSVLSNSPTLSVNSLTGFGNVCSNNTSGPNSFTISGTDLTTANITVGALSGYTFSTTAGGTYTSTLNLVQSGGSYSQPIYVKFTPTAVQTFNGNIVIGGGGATSVNVATTGSGIACVSTVTTSTVLNITSSGATLSGEVSTDGGAAVTELGFVYGTSTNPTTANTKVQDGTGTGAFSEAITGLTAGTTYYVRAYAINTVGTAYGNEVSFTTLSPSLTLSSNATNNTINSGTSVTFTATPSGTSATNYLWKKNGIIISGATNATYTTSDLVNGDIIGVQLSANTGTIVNSNLVLHLNAGDQSSYSGSGTTWTDISTNSNNVTLPTTLATSYSSTTGAGSFNFQGNSSTTIQSNAVNNWNITSNNALSVETWVKRTNYSNYQFWFSTPDLYYRLGVNPSGYLFWDMGQYTDRNPGIQVSEGVWHHIVYTAGIESGNITTRVYVDGVNVATQNEGISTLSSITNYLIGDGQAPGQHPLNGNMGLIRVYNKTLSAPEITQNYNAEVNRFTTEVLSSNSLTMTVNSTHPTVTTSTVLNITPSGVTLNGEVISDGGATVTERGFVYGTSTNPTTANTKVQDGTGTGVFTEAITGLAAGTIYYVRAYAINSVGTSYGANQSFTTQAAVSGTSVVTNVACNSGTDGAINLTPTGGTGPYTFDWGGGVLTEDRTGLVAGTYAVVITDVNGYTGTVSGITVAQPSAISFTTTTLAGYDYNLAYSQTIVATGGTGTKTYAVTAGSLPSGFTLSSNGDITGTSTQVADSNFTVTVTDANSCTATYNYTLKLNQIPITVTADASQTKVYGDSDPVLTYSVTPSLLFGDSFTGTLTRVSGENIGTYAITQGSLSAGSKYLITYISKDFSITAKPITVTANTSQTKVYGTVDPILTYSVSPSLVGSDVFTGALTRVSGENVGTYAINQGSLSAGSNYTISYVSKDFSITAKPITVTADVSQTKVYGAVNPVYTYSVSPALVNGDLFIGVLSRVSGENVGTYAINQGSLSAGSNYTISYVSKDFSITAKPITVTADVSQTKVYGAVNPVYTYSVSPALVSGDLFTGALSRVSGENIGTYAINQGSLSAGSNYTISYVSKDFAITAKPITVTADVSQTKVYGAVNPVYTYSVSPSLVSGDSFIGALSRVSGENVGTYAINQGSLSAGSNYTISYVSKDFSITAKPITVTADVSQTKVYGAVNPVYTYSVSPSLVGSDAFTGTLTRVAGENVGTYAINQGSLSAGSNYTISYVSKDFSITAKPITVTADVSQIKVYGTTNPVYTYSVSPTLVSGDSFTGALSRVSGENVGTYVINQGSLSAGSNYNITYVAKDFAITAKPITVTADASQAKVYGTVDPTFTYSVSPSLVGSDAFTGALTRVVGENIGIYVINQGSLSAGSNYSVTYVSKDFSITAKPITVTADISQTKVYGAVNPVYTYSVSPILVSGDSFTGALSRVSGENVGTYAINQGSLSAGSNYTISYVSKDFVITAKPITVTADVSQTKVYGAVNPVYTYSVLPSLVGSDAFTGALIRVAGENVGTYAINQGSLSAGSNYTISYVSKDFSITAKPITVTATASQTKVYGATNPVYTYSVSPSLVGSDAFTGALTRVAGENVGTYAINQGSLSAGSNYTISYVSKDFSITAKPITVTATASQTKVYGATNPVYTYSVSPSLVGSDAFTGVLTRVAGENVGTYAINQGSLSAGSNYTISYVSKDFSITAKPITVTATASQTKVYGTSDPVYTYSVSPALVSGDSFTGALTRVTGENVGTYAITQGSLSAGSNYSISYVANNFSITKANQIITWNQTLGMGCDGETTIALTAVSNSGLPVTYTSSNTNIASVSNSSLNFQNYGSATVTASQAGNNNYNAAPVVVLPVVNSQPNLIRKQFEDIIFFDNSSKSFKAYSWYKNGVLVPSQTNQYFKESGALNGTYYAVGTKLDGTLIKSCPLTLSPTVEEEYIRIAPNPVRTDANFQLITNVSSNRLQNARIELYSVTGNLLIHVNTNQNTVDLKSPAVEGIYIVKMTLANGKYFTKNLLVKN